MTYVQPNASRRWHPADQWRDQLTNPSYRAAETIARAAVVCEYITTRSAAAVAHISMDDAHAYLELLTDLGVTSEILPWDSQNGRAVFHGRGDWDQVKATLRSAHLRR